MALITKRELKQLLHLHYIFEILLASAYVLLKTIPWISVRVFETSEFNSGEKELLMLTIIIIVFKTRRRGHVNFLPYLSSACTMAKVGNFLLFFYIKPIYGLTYSAILLGDEFEKRLAQDKSAKWLIEFYATWNPDCNQLSAIFSELSTKYGNGNLNFGKIDVSRSPNVAEKYNISSSITTKSLPSIIMFKNGREYTKRPLRDSRGRVIPFSFSYENIVNTFELA